MQERIFLPLFKLFRAALMVGSTCSKTDRDLDLLSLKVLPILESFIKYKNLEIYSQIKYFKILSIIYF